MLFSVFKRTKLYSWLEKERQKRDPFYSEENINAILKAKAQLDRGEGIEFDINKVTDEINLGKNTKKRP